MILIIKLTMDDNARGIKQHTTDIVVVLAVVFIVWASAEDAVEHQIWIWWSGRHLCHRLDGSGIWGPRCT